MEKREKQQEPESERAIQNKDIYCKMQEEVKSRKQDDGKSRKREREREMNPLASMSERL